MVYRCLARVHLRDLRHDAVYGAAGIARANLSDTEPAWRPEPATSALNRASFPKVDVHFTPKATH
jgi:hypothetical protein